MIQSRRIFLGALLTVALVIIVAISELAVWPRWIRDRVTKQSNSGLQKYSSALAAAQQHGVAWCILDSNNTWSFWHFPHASQSLFPCWSYFESVRDENPKMACGFWFRNWTTGAAENSWQSSLMTAMGCIVTENPPEFQNQHIHEMKLVGGWETQEGGKRTVPDIHWFDRPRDAWNLRIAVLEHYEKAVPDRPRPVPEASQLRIGILYRNPDARRGILNLPEIAAGLQNVFPRAVITNKAMEGMNLGEQAQYFASQDIIIAGHGAALTNCVFLQPDSLVVQLYPKHYSPTFFYEPLIRQVKSHAYAWYASYPEDPLQDHLLNLDQSLENKHADMAPPVNEIVAIVLNATREIGLLKGY